MIPTVAVLTPVIMFNYVAQYSIRTTLHLVTLSIDAHSKGGPRWELNPGPLCCGV